MLVPASPVRWCGWNPPFPGFPTAETSPGAPHPPGSGLSGGWLHPSRAPGIWPPACFPGLVPGLRDEPKITRPAAGHQEMLKLLPLPARAAGRV